MAGAAVAREVVVLIIVLVVTVVVITAAAAIGFGSCRSKSRYAFSVTVYQAFTPSHNSEVFCTRVYG